MTHASFPVGPLSSLQPQTVWRHFATLCRIPRQSKQEGELRGHLKQWADRLGLAYGLRLPGVEIAPNTGAAHRRNCLEALALSVLRE